MISSNNSNIYHTQVEVTPEKPDSSKNSSLGACQQIMNHISQKNIFESSRNLNNISARDISDLNRSYKKNIAATILPVDETNNLAEHYSDHPDVHFLFNSSRELGNTHGDGHIYLYHDEIINYLAEELGSAFQAGKKMVVARVSLDNHSVTAVFDIHGHFTLIDSMDGEKIYDEKINEIIEKLNNTKVKGKKNEIIRFKWKKVTLGVQSKGENECARYSLLFSHQILKDQKTKAYEKILSAFSQNLLQTYSDIQNIGNMVLQPIARRPNYTTDIRPFMLSWVNKMTVGVEDWQDIPLSKLPKNSIYKLQNEYVVNRMGIPPKMLKSEIFLQTENGNKSLAELAEDYDFSNLTLRDIIPQDGEVTYFIVSNNPDKAILETANIGSNILLRTKVKKLRLTENC